MLRSNPYNSYKYKKQQLHSYIREQYIEVNTLAKNKLEPL